MSVWVKWRYLAPSVAADDGWRQIRCLYAYLAPRTREVLRIGMAGDDTVRDRWNGNSAFWQDLEQQRGIRDHLVLLGELYLLETQRLTYELLCDVESLLINRVNPWGNIQCQASRISRPGLEVLCSGDWPLGRRRFFDDDWVAA